jgi:hypothetical protein
VRLVGRCIDPAQAGSADDGQGGQQYPLAQAGATDLQIDGNQYRARVLPLARQQWPGSGGRVAAFGQRGGGAYQRLQLILLSITVLGVLGAAVASAVMARRITSPLRDLASVAKRLGRAITAKASTSAARMKSGASVPPLKPCAPKSPAANSRSAAWLIRTS